MAASARSETAQGAVAGAVKQAPQPLFGQREDYLARQRNPRLYWEIMQEQDSVSFDQIAKAWWMGNNPAKKPVDDEERQASLFLEYQARNKFVAMHGGIEKDYWEDRPWAACALTSDGCVHSVMNSSEPELVLYEDRVHQLCRDARRAFEDVAGPRANRELKEVGEMLYIVLARVIFAASVLENSASQHEMDEALATVRAEWKLTYASVQEVIQRQARFEYFEGVSLGALITIPLLAVAGWACARFGVNHFTEPGSFTAAIIGGATGSVISVTQRMTTKTKTPLLIDFTAPKSQKIAFGALRPAVGAVFGAVVYFAIVGGLLAVQAGTGKDSSVELAFFAVAGFAAGFSERFATDVLNRASSGMAPATAGKEYAERPDELALLLSEQPHHAGAPADIQEHRAATPPKPPGERHEG